MTYVADNQHGTRPFSLTAAGHRLEAYWIGPPPGGSPTLVFLHEGLGSARAWLGFAEAVAAATGCGALVYSRAGGRVETLLLPRCGHSPHRDRREETLAAIVAKGCATAEPYQRDTEASGGAAEACRDIPEASRGAAEAS